MYDAKPETALDKTTRIVRQIIGEERAQRDAKNSRLRSARLEKEANTPLEIKTSKSSRSCRTNGTSPQ